MSAIPSLREKGINPNGERCLFEWVEVEDGYRDDQDGTPFRHAHHVCGKWDLHRDDHECALDLLRVAVVKLDATRSRAAEAERLLRSFLAKDLHVEGDDCGDEVHELIDAFLSRRRTDGDGA